MRTAEMGRRFIESLMTSTCTIRAQEGEPTTDPDTGAVTEAPGDVLYSGKCRVKPAAQWGRMAEAGGEQVTPTTIQVSIPYEVSTVRRGSWVTVDASPDASLVGRRLEVRFTPAAGDNLTARRLLCEEPN